MSMRLLLPGATLLAFCFLMLLFWASNIFWGLILTGGMATGAAFAAAGALYLLQRRDSRAP